MSQLGLTTHLEILEILEKLEFEREWKVRENVLTLDACGVLLCKMWTVYQLALLK